MPHSVRESKPAATNHTVNSTNTTANQHTQLASASSTRNQETSQCFTSPPPSTTQVNDSFPSSKERSPTAPPMLRAWTEERDRGNLTINETLFRMTSAWRGAKSSSTTSPTPSTSNSTTASNSTEKGQVRGG